MPERQHAASPDEEQAFRQSLDAMLVRVVHAARDGDEAAAKPAAEAEWEPLLVRAAAAAAKALDGVPTPVAAPAPVMAAVVPADLAPPAPAPDPVVRRMHMRAGVAPLASLQHSAPVPEGPAESAAPPPAPGRHRRARMAWMGVPVAALLLWGMFLAVRPPMGGPPERVAQAGTLDHMAPTAAGSMALTPPVPGSAREQPPALPPTRFEVASDADASTESLMLAELTQAVAPEGVALDGAGSSASPGLGIARYDALRAHPGAWRIMAPLNAEEVYVLVRADSPLRYLHELRGRRINVGPAGGARARSADALYRRLFGVALPPAPAAALPRDTALAQLLGRRGLDALLFFDGQPSRWLAVLPEAERRQLRLLALAPEHASTQRALQAYLSATVPPLDGGAPVETLGVLSFLVAADPVADAGRMVQALCARLPALRRSGHPKWAEVQPALQLPAALLPVPQDGAALQACAPGPVLSSTPSTSKPGA